MTPRGHQNQEITHCANNTKMKENWKIHELLDIWPGFVVFSVISPVLFSMEMC